MNKKDFIQQAIKSGYTDNNCEGWNWIRENLTELDYIFQTEEYKKQNGMKYKCMPFLIKNDDLSNIEESVLGTAWYLNNKREHKKEKSEKIKRFAEMGFVNIENDEKLHGKKIEFIIDSSDELLGGITKMKGKLYWSSVDKLLMAMKSKCRRRGYWITKNVYVKLLKV